KDLYLVENGHQFAFGHCWVILLNCDRWKDLPEDNGKKTALVKTNNKCPLTSSSAGPKDILYSTSSVLTRPMGTKAVKAAKKACKTPNHDHLSSNADIEELAKSNQAMASANVAKALAMQEIAKDKILSREPEGMEGACCEYHLLKQHKILARIKGR
ncbi:hypothetical protein DFH28DRAFT_892116, partial [Melampsora americana]